MRKLIAGMKISIDGKINGKNGEDADWVHGWSDDYGMMSEVDACVIGGTYSGYEPYWTRIHDAPYEVHPETGKLPTPSEVEWAHFAVRTPHYVLSKTLDVALWPQTSFLRSLDDVAAQKQRPGKDIYLIGGAQTTASLIDAGLVDELRLIAYPLIAGDGQAIFETSKCRRPLQLKTLEPLDDGRVSLIYTVG